MEGRVVFLDFMSTYRVYAPEEGSSRGLLLIVKTDGSFAALAGTASGL